MCSSPNKSLPISHWSPAKAKQPPLNHDKLWACFLPSYSTPKWLKYPLTHTKQNQERDGNSENSPEKFRDTSIVVRIAPCGEEKAGITDSVTHFRKGLGWHVENTAWQVPKQRYPNATLESPSVSRIPTCGCWTWYGTAQSPAFLEQQLEVRQDSLGNLKWH